MFSEIRCSAFISKMVAVQPLCALQCMPPYQGLWLWPCCHIKDGCSALCSAVLLYQEWLVQRRGIVECMLPYQGVWLVSSMASVHAIVECMLPYQGGPDIRLAPSNSPPFYPLGQSGQHDICLWKKYWKVRWTKEQRMWIKRDYCLDHCGMQMCLCHETTVAKTLTWCIISMASGKPLFLNIITIS